MNLRNNASLSAALLLALATLSTAANNAATDRSPEEVKAGALANYGKLPLSFEENRGQADARVKFLSHGNAYSILLTPSEVLLNLQSVSKARPRQAAIRMSFPGAKSSPAITGGERQSAVSSYFLGNDPAKWVAGAPNYARVRYRELYRGVDLAFYGNQGQLEYDFVVAPGASTKAIRLQFEGVDGMRLDPAGDLVLSAANGEIRQHKPVVYQESAGARQIVEGRYVIQAHNRVAFEIASYDKRRPLVIDPVLTFGTYLGSPGDEVFGLSAAGSSSTYPAVAVDVQGNVYVTGYNGSTAASFTGNPAILTSSGPEPGGGVDVFLVKMNATGTTLLYSVVFGGGLTDVGGGVAVDTQGNAYVAGYTNSLNFPITTGAPQTTLNGGNNAFVTKVNATGTALAYSTYLGGSGDFYGRAIAVDRSGNAYVTGTAEASGGTPFPLVGPISSTPSSGFLTAVNATGTGFAYSTYLAAGIGYGVAVDSGSNAYITGSTASATAPSPSQGYVLKVFAGGTGLAYGPVYLGTSGAGMQTIGFGIAVDAESNAYVTGMTNDPHFPQLASAAQGTFGGGLTDGFALKLNSGGGIVYGTYIGGLGSNFLPERGSGIGVDLDGNAYVSGTTQCINFPSVSPISGARNGGPVALAKGTISGSTSNWSAASLGGSFDQVDALAFDAGGNLYAGASALNATGGGMYKLVSGSSSWTQINTGITSSTINSIAVDPNTPSTVYASGSGHLYQTANGGANWTQLSQGVGIPAVIAVAKTSPSSTVYVGSSAGIIYSTNAGSSWNTPTTPPPSGTTINALAVDPNNSNTAYAGTSNSVYQTVNGGATWTQVAAGLPTGLGGNVTGMAVYSVSNPSTLYAATPNGLYYTSNASAGWAQITFAPEVDSTPVLVAVDTADNVYVAFQGAGVATGTGGGTQQSDWSALTYNGLTQNQIEALVAAPAPNAGTAYAGIVAATEAFLTQIGPTGAFLASSCIGGSDNNLGQNIAVTPNGVTFVSGLTVATNFPATPGAVQTTNAGNYDAFVARVDNEPFSDVPPSNAFFNFINVMYETGITGGCATNPLQYCPNSTTTRGEMAVFIITAMFGSNSFSYTTTPYFTDVPASNIFFKFIQKMKDLNITSGCGGTDFCPDDPVTRGEMAVFIIVARYGTIPFTYPSTPYFADVPSSSSFFPFVQKMAQLGITAGCAPGMYCPNDSLTRGQMAVFIVTGLLDELLPLTTPIITQVVPSVGNTGQTLTVTISGIGTSFGASTQVAVPTGITASNLTVVSPTTLTVQLDISSSAVPSLTATNGSLYTIAITTGSQEADLPNGFVVQ